MARVKVKKKSVAEYQLTLTQEEFDLVCGVVGDLADKPDIGPERSVAMIYTEGAGRELSVPKKKTRHIFAGIAAAMDAQATPYFDHYDWWKSEPLDSATEN